MGVLFFEALAVVREGRYEDYELIAVCQRGDARGSAKMREACLKARAEIASPVLFKAITVAVGTAFKDFSDTVGSPFKFAVVVLFIISSVALPIAPWARAFFGNSAVEPMNGVHFISYAPSPYAHQPRRGFRHKVGSAMRRLKLRSGPTIVEPEDDDVEPGDYSSSKYVSGPSDWSSIDIGDGSGPSRPVSPPRGGHAKYE